MSAMPKSTLSIDEVTFMEYIVYLKYDINLWRKSLSGQSLNREERNSFYALSTKVMTNEGLNDLYQGAIITNKVQQDIDASIRLFNTVQLENEPLQDFKEMPLS